MEITKITKNRYFCDFLKKIKDNRVLMKKLSESRQAHFEEAGKKHLLAPYPCGMGYLFLLLLFARLEEKWT